MNSEHDIALALEGSLAEGSKPDCGCGGAKSGSNPFNLPAAAAVSAESSFDRLSAEIDAALADQAIESSFGDTENPFADLQAVAAEDLGGTLEHLLTLAECTPGLKITLSF